MFKGAITAIVTPFKNGQFDEAAYRELIEFQIKGGIHGIVPCGTTGESPTLSHAEHKRVVETCIDQVKKRVVVIAGSGSNNTAEALELTKHAQAGGGGRGPDDHSLLQQAHPGRALSALQDRGVPDQDSHRGL